MIRTQSTDITLTVAKLAALFCSLVVALYAALQVEPGPVVEQFISWCPFLAVVLWLQKDARGTAVPVLDWGYFLVLAWPVLIPWYAFRTRGRAGWWLLLGLAGLMISASVTGFIVPWLIYLAKYAFWYVRWGA